MAAWVVCGMIAVVSAAEAQIQLGTSQDFAVLAGSTITNTGPTVITGNVGVSPGSAITGFPPGIINGTIHAGDGVAAQAHNDVITAFNQVAGEAFSPANNLSGQNLGGLTLTPGVYHFNNAAQLTGTLQLDMQGDPNAEFHFQIGTTLISAANAQILLLNGTTSNIFWQVGSSATFGTNTAFLGDILAQNSITLTTGANLNGRALAIDGAVTLDTNTIVRPAIVLPPGRFWTGSTDNLWSSANWSPDVSGANPSTLAPVADVVFSANGAQNQNTVLGADTTISSLTINDPTPVTISGPGVLSIVGTGAATGITVNNGAGLATINSDLVLSGPAQAMTVNNAAGLVINGAVSGADGLTKAGVGNLTLAGANTYLGATAILAGSLQAGAANVIPNASPVSVQGGALFALNGFNQSIGSLAGAGAVDLGTAHLVTGNDNTSTLFSGVISGTGSVEKVGTGTWALTGANTFTGLTTIRAGTLAVDGSIAGSAVVAGGTLRGVGTIGGSVLNQALVQPGGANAPGTLTIGGNYNQSPAGTLSIRLSSPASFDLLTIGGAAFLSGALNVTYLDGFEAKPGDVFKILTAAGGVSGKFDTFNDAHSTGTLLGLKVIYQKNAVLLKFTQGSFTDLGPGLGLTPNELAVAQALDALAARRAGDKLIRDLDLLQLAQLRGALSLLSPEDFAAIFSSGYALSRIQVGNLERRLGEVRQGSDGFSDSGFAVTDSHGAQNYDGKSTMGLDGKSSRSLESKESKEVVEASVADEHRWGFFISGTGEIGDLESTASARGSDFTTGGINVGVDYRVNRHLVLGASIGYANTTSDLSRNGSLDIDTGKGSLYATLYGNGFYLNGIVGGGYGSIDTARRTWGGMARGQTNATDFNGLLGTGYDIHHGAFTWGPVASVQYSTVGIDSFTERGPIGALRIDAQSQDSVTTSVGMKASYSRRIGRVVVTPEIRAQWQHEYLDRSSSIAAGFSSGSSFTVQGPEIGRDALLLDAGLSAQLTANTAVFVFYTGELFRENYTIHSVNGGLRVSF